MFSDVASGDAVDGIGVGDTNLRVQNALKVVVGFVGLEFYLVDGQPIFVGQIAEIRAFAHVETELEGLAFEAELLEGVRATVCWKRWRKRRRKWRRKWKGRWEEG